MSSFADKLLDAAEDESLSPAELRACCELRSARRIISDDSRKGRGFYRLPTRSFAAWINAFKSASARAEETGTVVAVPLDTTF